MSDLGGGSSLSFPMPSGLGGLRKGVRRKSALQSDRLELGSQVRGLTNPVVHIPGRRDTGQSASSQRGQDSCDTGKPEGFWTGEKLYQSRRPCADDRTSGAHKETTLRVSNSSKDILEAIAVIHVGCSSKQRVIRSNDEVMLLAGARRRPCPRGGIPDEAVFGRPLDRRGPEEPGCAFGRGARPG